MLQNLEQIMMAENRRVFREGRVSAEEADRLNDIRRKALEEFPPDPNRPRPAENGVGAQVRAAREAKGLSWYGLAELTGTTDAETIRDIEYGRDVKLSHVEAVASALGLTLQLVEQSV